MNLLKQTQELLNSRPRDLTLSDIATKCDVQVSWLSDLANDKLGDYGVKKVEKVFEYLTQGKAA